MDLDRLLDRAEVAGNLFVQFASDYVLEHFALTRCECGQARADFGKFGLLTPTVPIFLNRHTNGCKQVFIVDRFGEEITRAVFHRLNALWNISGTCQENNGQETACLGEDVLELEPIQSGHGEVEHKTTHYLGIVLRQKLLCRRKGGHSNASRMQQARDGSPQGR